MVSNSQSLGEHYIQMKCCSDYSEARDSQLFFFGGGLGHNYIAPEHLLLGLLREVDDVAALVLKNLGADLSNVRTQASIEMSILTSGCFTITLKLKDYAFHNVGYKNDR